MVVIKEVTSESRDMGKHGALLCSFPGPVQCPTQCKLWICFNHPRLRTKKRNIRVLPLSLCTNSTMVVCVCCDVKRLFSLEIGAKLRT